MSYKREYEQLKEDNKELKNIIKETMNIVEEMRGMNQLLVTEHKETLKFVTAYMEGNHKELSKIKALH